MKVYELFETLDIKQVGGVWRIYDTVKKDFASPVVFNSAGEAETARDKMKATASKSNTSNTKVSTKPESTPKPKKGYYGRLWAKVVDKGGSFLKGITGWKMFSIIAIVVSYNQWSKIMEDYAKAYLYNGCRYNDNPSLPFDSDIGKGGIQASRMWQAEMARARYEMAATLSTGLIALVGGAATNLVTLNRAFKALSIGGLFIPGAGWVKSALAFVIGVGTTTLGIYMLQKLAKKTALWNGLADLWVDMIFTAPKMESLIKNWFGEYCDHSEPGTTNYTMGETSTYPADKLSESKKSAMSKIDKVKKELMKDKEFMQAYKKAKKISKQKAI